MAEYAFDITLRAVARVTAATEEDARRLLNKTIDCIDLMYSENNVLLTEASLADELEPVLYLLNGKELSFPSEAHYVAAAKAEGWLPCDTDTAKEYCEANDIDASEANPADAR